MHILQDYIKARVKLFLGRGVRRSYGQFGEDAVVQALLKNIKSGTYVDVGAYHPVLYSNTYAFYKKGWHGVAIDPNANLAPLFVLLRPRDTFVHAAIGEGGSGTYYAFSDGAYNTFDAAEAEKRKGLRWLKFLGEYQVSFKSLAEILKEQNIKHIDFLNIDVEGRDLDVLKSHDWSIRPGVIAVEDENFRADTPNTSYLYIFLRSKGYSLVGLCGLTLIFKVIE